MKNEIKPWEKQPDESSKAFQAFVLYRDLKLEERSYAKVAQILTKSRQVITDWASKYHWQLRVASWERELDRIGLKARMGAIEKMNERHANQSVAVSRTLFVPIEVLLKKMASPEWSKTIDELQNQPITVLIEMAKSVAIVMPNIMKMERLARGESTDESKLSGQFEAKHIDRKEYQVDITYKIEQYAEAIRNALELCKHESNT